MALQLPDQAIPQLREFVRGLIDKAPGVVLIGDGSATSPEQPIGWSCLLFEPARGVAYLLSGTVSFGTNNSAELQPYFQALLFHERLCDAQQRVPMRSVLIVSDSQVTVNCGNDEAKPTANHSLWAAVNAFRRVRCSLRWRHVPRNSNPWSLWMDDVAKFARMSSEAFQQGLLTPGITKVPWHTTSGAIENNHAAMAVQA